MPDENEVEDPDGTGEPKKESPGKRLREELETTLASNKDLRTRLALYEAGLGNLTDRQKKAIVREANEEGKEVTGELLKEIAKDLGFKAPKETKPDDTTTPPANSDGNEGKDGEEETPDPELETDMSYMDAIDRIARRGNSADPDSFESKVANAKSQDEVKALIRQHGQKAGILLEEDVD